MSEDIRQSTIRWRRYALAIADMHAATADDEAIERAASLRNHRRLGSECQEAIQLLRGDIYKGPWPDITIGKEQAVIGRLERSQRGMGIGEPLISMREPHPAGEIEDRDYLTGVSLTELVTWNSYWRGVTYRLGEFVAASLDEVAGKKSVSQGRKERLYGVAEKTRAMISGEHGPSPRQLEKICDRLERVLGEMGYEVPVVTTSDNADAEPVSRP